MFSTNLILHHTMNTKCIVALDLFFLVLGLDHAFAWTEYQPVIFSGDISQIYSKMPVFHGYTQEFLNSQQVKQVCLDAESDGVKLDYCK
ncbi:MAG: hypothetical protein KGI10_01385 [Thaumarchaeota archaeon]|nr:hypothetical protein [Nitrososphaerota archaeon]